MSKTFMVVNILREGVNQGQKKSPGKYRRILFGLNLNLIFWQELRLLPALTDVSLLQMQ